MTEKAATAKAVTVKHDIREISASLGTAELLRLLVNDRFPGETVVTASLRAPSIVVLKMISGIDPSVPVIFCQREPVFDESVTYRATIIKLLGLKNVSLNDGHETRVGPGDSDHCERMWVQYRDMPGSSDQTLHLNDCLAPYKCWISAVYHMARPDFVRHRVDVEGRLIRVDPLVRWTRGDVNAFMREHDLAYHRRAQRQFSYEGKKERVDYPTYPF